MVNTILTCGATTIHAQRSLISPYAITFLESIAKIPSPILKCLLHSNPMDFMIDKGMVLFVAPLSTMQLRRTN